MIKLYKEREGLLFYAETWANDSTVVVHTGVVGQTGETEEFSVSPSRQARFYRDFRVMYGQQGYREIPFDKLTEIVVQRELEGREQNLVEAQWLGKATEVLNHVLGWTGLGHVEGYDTGQWLHPQQEGYVQNIYCYVVDERLGASVTLQALTGEGLLEGARIGWRQRGEDEYHLIHPHPVDMAGFYL